MWKIARNFLVMVLLLNSLWCAPLYAGDNTCIIMAPEQNDVWVIIFDADDDGNRGKILFKGKIAAGQQINITSSVGKIHYDFTLKPDDAYEGDVSRDCFQKNTILIE